MTSIDDDDDKRMMIKNVLFDMKTVLLLYIENRRRRNIIIIIKIIIIVVVGDAVDCSRRKSWKGEMFTFAKTLSSNFLLAATINSASQGRRILLA